MASTARKKVKFVLNVKQLEAALDKAAKKAEKSIKTGRVRVAAARRAGNKEVLEANVANLKGAMNAKKKIAGAKKLMAQSCCDQFFNCDPEFF